MYAAWMYSNYTKVTEGVSGQQGISRHGPSFRSLGAVFANALESSKVGYACALTIIRKNANGANARGMNAVSGIKRLSGNRVYPLHYLSYKMSQSQDHRSRGSMVSGHREFSGVTGCEPGRQLALSEYGGVTTPC